MIDAATSRRPVVSTGRGGLRVVSEPVPGVRSVAIGVWIGVGSRFERVEEAGISHFLEHMLFKGTPTLSPEEIAQVFDGLGGEVNAATGKDYTVLYRGEKGMVAHEFVIDARPFKASAGIEVEDIAKRLMDYGFLAPTMSFPVPGTLMIEPTESESRAELDRLCEALIGIREEIRAIEDGQWSRSDNPLKNAPHPASVLLTAEWTHAYTREQAAYPAAWTREHKFWPPVARVDNTYGDRNLVCLCPPLEAYAAE